MKRLLFYTSILLILGCSPYFQIKKTNLFQRVVVPDSIVNILEESYNKNAKNVNAGKNIFNLIDRNDFEFKDGIFSFQGQGPHFPRRVFIYNKTKLFIFESEGAFNPKGVIQEFAGSIYSLNLTNEQARKYTEIIAKYLYEESGNTYGTEIKEKAR